MDIDDDLFARLAAPFPPESVSWRAGSTTKKRGQDHKYPAGTKAMALAYIDSRDVMDRLDAVVGVENWQDEYVTHGTATLCRLGVRIGDGWVWKSDGAGQTQVEKEKGQFSDALKRAGVKWGIGRYLYDLDSPWVAINERGQIEKKDLEDLQNILSKSTQTNDWGTKTNQTALRILQATLPEVYTPETISGFISDREGLLKQLPNQAKEELWSTIQRIQQHGQQAAE